MVSFDLASFFKNVPLDKIVEINPKRLSEMKEITSTIPKCEMKELLYLCTRHAHFSFNDKIYISTMMV